MADIKERLDNLRIHIQEPEFLEGKGLSNEVNIRIFCYDAGDEMTVRQFVDQITTDQSLGCNLVECNLYETFLALCDDIDITDAIPEMEEADGKEFLLEQLHSAIGEAEFIEKILRKRLVHLISLINQLAGKLKDIAFFLCLLCPHNPPSFLYAIPVSHCLPEKSNPYFKHFICFRFFVNRLYTFFSFFPAF